MLLAQRGDEPLRIQRVSAVRMFGLPVFPPSRSVQSSAIVKHALSISLEAISAGRGSPLTLFVRKELKGGAKVGLDVGVLSSLLGAGELVS